jgi:hypothetical protein
MALSASDVLINETTPRLDWVSVILSRASHGAVLPLIVTYATKTAP